MRSDPTGRPVMLSRVEQCIYLAVGALLLIGLALYLWVRGYFPLSFGSMGPITQAGFLVVVLFAVAQAGFSVRRSLYARRLMISAVSGILALGLIEATLQICNCSPQHSTLVAHREAVKLLDIVMEQRSRGIDIYPQVGLQTANEQPIAYPDLFLSQISNQLVMLWPEDDGFVITKMDENGFRNPPGLYDQTESFDVFLLGGSFTVGSSVPDGFTIADQIRQASAYTVYNAGVGGAGLLHKVAVFIEYGIQKEPKNVIVIMPEILSLHRGLVRELKMKRFREYYSEHRSSNLRAKRVVQDQVLRERVEAMMPALRESLMEEPSTSPLIENLVLKVNLRSKIVILIHTNSTLRRIRQIFGWQDLLVRDKPYEEHGVPRCEDTTFIPPRKELMKDALSWLNQTVSEYGGTLFVAYVPANRYFGYIDWPECEHDMVVGLTQELKIPLIDVIPIMSEHEDPANFFARAKRFGHPNRDGYRLIAEQIVERLESHPKVPGD